MEWINADEYVIIRVSISATHNVILSSEFSNDGHIIQRKNIYQVSPQDKQFITVVTNRFFRFTISNDGIKYVSSLSIKCESYENENVIQIPNPFDEYRRKAALIIQNQWDICRYNPKYKICRNILNKEWNEITGAEGEID